MKSVASDGRTAQASQGRYGVSADMLPSIFWAGDDLRLPKTALCPV